jgi:hypothetical protein
MFLLNLADCYCRMDKAAEARIQYGACINFMEDRSDESLENAYYIRPDNLTFIKRKMDYYKQRMVELQAVE